MTILDILQYVALGLTVVTGLFALVWPRKTLNFTGLLNPNARGITEIRAVLGGGFIALGLAPAVLGAQAAYQMLGLTYLGIGLARVVGLALDRSFERSNWISLAVEFILGILLLL